MTGANLSYHNTGFVWQLFCRKMGLKPRQLAIKNPTGRRNMAVDDGTTFPRLVGLCSKFNVGTPPTSNTAADAPTGVGDLCVYVASNSAGEADKIAVANIDIYRCTAFTDSSTFTWTKIVD